MQRTDVVNGLFELFGGCLLWVQFARLRRDRQVKGVYIPAWAFFAGWGFWNLFYYPSLGQWASFGGGLVVAAANVAWLVLAIKLTIRPEVRP